MAGGDPDAGRVLAELAWRLRARAALCVVVAGILFFEGFVTWWPDQGAPQMAIGLLLGSYGLWSLARLPAYLRHPEDILRIDPTAPRATAHLHIVMASGRKHWLRASPVDRLRIRDALERQGAAIRLRARVVRR
jgi:hypothetical protein